MAYTIGLCAPQRAQKAQRRHVRRALRVAPETKITIIGVLFLAALVSMSIVTAVLSVLGPGGDAGQEIMGIVVVTGLALMLGCAVWLIHAIEKFPKEPLGRIYRDAAHKRLP